MRSIWTVVSIILLLHALALAGFVGWLQITDRLNRERLAEAVDLFRPTIDEAEAARQEQAAQTQMKEEQAREAARMQAVGFGQGQLQQQIELDQQRDEIAMQRYERFTKDREALERYLKEARELLEKQRKELDAERQAFNQALEQERQKRADEDFQQTVKMYEQLQAKQTKAIFQQLLAQQRTGDVVDFLAAMQLRKAAAVIKEFKTDEEIAQAAHLLEALRKRGVNLLDTSTARSAAPGQAS